MTTFKVGDKITGDDPYHLPAGSVISSQFGSRFMVTENQCLHGTFANTVDLKNHTWTLKFTIEYLPGSDGVSDDTVSMVELCNLPRGTVALRKTSIRPNRIFVSMGDGTYRWFDANSGLGKGDACIPSGRFSQSAQFQIIHSN